MMAVLVKREERVFLSSGNEDNTVFSKGAACHGVFSNLDRLSNKTFRK
jgi:hypothetical protein